MIEKSPLILAQLNSDSKNDNHSHRLALPLASPQKPEIFRQKAQIVSSPGSSPKQRDRYRVMVGDRVVGDFLTLDEAIALANQSTHQ
jgi:hypothetical protein